MCFKWGILGMPGVLVVSMLWTSGPAAAGEGRVVDMPTDDRVLLDHYLGSGVVGKALPSEPIGEPMRYVQFGEDATHSVQITTGDLKGQNVDHGVRHVHGKAGVLPGRYSTTPMSSSTDRISRATWPS